MTVELKNEPPKEVGYYWFYDGTEHTPTVLKVTKATAKGKFYAENSEYGFMVDRVSNKNEWWGRIPSPVVNGKTI